jgi:type II secretory ATPase GspE/PulE/Tfp pilus assembly ATPase PilB-like protein
MNQFHDDTTQSRLADLRKRGEETLMQTLATQYGLTYIDLHGVTINPEALTKIPEVRAKQAHVVAFALTRQSLSVATNTPHEAATRQLLEELVRAGYTLTIYLASTASIEHGFARYADQRMTTASKKGVLDINTDAITEIAGSIKTITDVNNAITKVSAINSPRRISETLELMFAGALALKASDIHIEPAELGIRLRYRLDGVLIAILTPISMDD